MQPRLAQAIMVVYVSSHSKCLIMLKGKHKYWQVK